MVNDNNRPSDKVDLPVQRHRLENQHVLDEVLAKDALKDIQRLNRSGDYAPSAKEIAGFKAMAAIDSWVHGVGLDSTIPALFNEGNKQAHNNLTRALGLPDDASNEQILRASEKQPRTPELEDRILLGLPPNTSDEEYRQARKQPALNEKRRFGRSDNASFDEVEAARDKAEREAARTYLGLPMDALTEHVEKAAMEELALPQLRREYAPIDDTQRKILLGLKEDASPAELEQAMNAARSSQLTRYGLPNKASEDQLRAAQQKCSEQAVKQALGLPQEATLAEVVAAQRDAEYTKLRRNLGLPEDAPMERVERKSATQLARVVRNFPELARALFLDPGSNGEDNFNSNAVPPISDKELAIRAALGPIEVSTHVRGLPLDFSQDRDRELDSLWNNLNQTRSLGLPANASDKQIVEAMELAQKTADQRERMFLGVPDGASDEQYRQARQQPAINERRRYGLDVKASVDEVETAREKASEEATRIYLGLNKGDSMEDTVRIAKEEIALLKKDSPDAPRDDKERKVLLGLKEDATKDDLEKAMELAKSARLVRFGLPNGASEDQLMAARTEASQHALRHALGLSKESSLEDVINAQLEAQYTHERRFLHLPEDASAAEVNRERQSRRQNGNFNGGHNALNGADSPPHPKPHLQPNPYNPFRLK